MSDTKFKKNLLYCGLLSAMIFSGLNTTQVKANETKGETPVENEAIKKIIPENKQVENTRNKKDASELTAMMGLTTYSLNKDEKLEENFEKILLEVFTKDKLNDVSDLKTDSITVKKLGEKALKDKNNKEYTIQLYQYGDYLISSQNFNKNSIDKQHVTIKSKLLSNVELKMVELFTTIEDKEEKQDLSPLIKTLEKGDVVSKNIIIDVKDVNAPTIHLYSSSKKITVGDSFNINNYIEKVTDDTDSNLEYTINGSYNTEAAGTYTLTIKAKDKSGNEGSANFTLTVEKPAPANNIVSTARSLSGSPYVWGGTTPSGFDCSGFVQYVFRQHGVYLPRVASAQGASGYAVSASQMRAGDIIIYGGGVHVGIYIGNGQVIHALNPSVGIHVGQWNYPYNGGVTAIRRVI